MKNCPSIEDSSCDRSEIIVQNDNIAASFATSVPLPIANPTSACLRAVASLTPSPVHADDKPQFLRQSNKPALICRKRSCHNPQSRQLLLQLLVAHLRKLIAGQKRSHERHRSEVRRRAQWKQPFLCCLR